MAVLNRSAPLRRSADTMENALNAVKFAITTANTDIIAQNAPRIRTAQSATTPLACSAILGMSLTVLKAEHTVHMATVAFVAMSLPTVFTVVALLRNALNVPKATMRIRTAFVSHVKASMVMDALSVISTAADAAQQSIAVLVANAPLLVSLIVIRAPSIGFSGRITRVLDVCQATAKVVTRAIMLENHVLIPTALVALVLLAAGANRDTILTIILECAKRVG